MTNRTRAYLWLTLNTICWGAAFIVVKPALEVTSPFRHLLVRYLLASALSLPILYYYWGKITRFWRQVVVITLIEFLGTTLALALVYQGLAYSHAIQANLITISLPLFVTLGAIVFLKEKQERHEWIGTAISLIGAVLLVTLPLLTSQIDLSSTSFLGSLLILGHNLTNVAYFLLAKQYYRRLPKFFVTAVSFWVGLLSFGLLSWFEVGSLTQLINLISLDITRPMTLIAGGYMALFGSIIGLTAYYQGQDLIEASEASVFWFLQPVVAIPLAILFLNESISITQLAALALIVVGVWITESRRKKKRY